MSLPALALARSRRQAASWGRRRWWEENETTIEELLAQSLSADALRLMRLQSGRDVRTFDVAELAGMRLDGAKAAWPFLRVFAGLLRYTDYRGLVGSSQAIADMLGAFGPPVSEMCVRRALDGLEKAGLVSSMPVFKRYSEDAPFISTIEGNRALLVRESGRLFTAGPNLVRWFDELRAKAPSFAPRSDLGCSERPTLPDPIQDPEKAYYAHARALSPPSSLALVLPPLSAQEQQPKPDPEAASPLKESTPTAPTVIQTAPSALEEPEKTAFQKGEGSSPAKIAAKAPPLALVASSDDSGTKPTPHAPKRPKGAYAKVWIAASAEEDFAQFCRIARRKRVDVLAEALAAYGVPLRGFPVRVGPARVVQLVPPSRPPRDALQISLPPLGQAAADLARTLRNSAFGVADGDAARRFSHAEVTRLSALLEAGDVARVADELDRPSERAQPLPMRVEPEPEDREAVELLAGRVAAAIFAARADGKISAQRADDLWALVENGDASLADEALKKSLELYP